MYLDSAKNLIEYLNKKDIQIILCIFFIFYNVVYPLS